VNEKVWVIFKKVIWHSSLCTMIVSDAIHFEFWISFHWDIYLNGYLHTSLTPEHEISIYCLSRNLLNSSQGMIWMNYRFLSHLRFLCQSKDVDFTIVGKSANIHSQFSPLIQSFDHLFLVYTNICHIRKVWDDWFDHSSIELGMNSTNFR